MVKKMSNLKTLLILMVSTIILYSCSQDKSKEPISKKDLEVPKDLNDKISYTIGHQYASHLRADSLKLNLDYFFKGIQDGLDSNFKFIPLDSMQKYIEIFASSMAEKREKNMKEEQEKQKALQEKTRIEVEKAAKTAKIDGEKFLEENKTKSGVKVTKSGLQYKVMNEGSGRLINDNDIVKVHMSINALNLPDLQNTRGKEPLIVPIKELFPGWKEGMKLMKKGSRFELYIPANLAFGDKGFGQAIPPGATVILNVEVLDFSTKEDLEFFRNRMMQKTQQMMNMQQQQQIQQQMQQQAPNK